jgi:hypothetical protein
MDADLDTLATALYVKIDDTLADRPELGPWRPRVGIFPKLSDAELLALAVLKVLLGFEHEAHWVRHAREHLRHLFPMCLARLATTSGSGSRLTSSRC